jgi:hypothetical protein
MKGKRTLRVLVAVVWIAVFAFGTAHAQTPGVVPDLSSWVNSWFRLTITRTAYHFPDIGVNPSPGYSSLESMGTAFMKLTDWDSVNRVFTADAYVRSPETGKWVTTPFATFDIQYFAGSKNNFVGSTQITIPNDVSINLVFFFTAKRYWGGFVVDGTTNVRTLSGSMLEIDDVPDSTERWAGSTDFSGPMVPLSSVPLVLRGL